MGKYVRMGAEQAAASVVAIEEEFAFHSARLSQNFTADVCQTIRDNIANREVHGFYTSPTEEAEVHGLVDAAIGDVVIEPPDQKRFYRWASGILQTDDVHLERVRQALPDGAER